MKWIRGVEGGSAYTLLSLETRGITEKSDRRCWAEIGRLRADEWPGYGRGQQYRWYIYTGGGALAAVELRERNAPVNYTRAKSDGPSSIVIAGFCYSRPRKHPAIARRAIISGHRSYWFVWCYAPGRPTRPISSYSILFFYAQPKKWERE